MSKVSVVVSVYNEEQSLNAFYHETSKILESCSWDYELVFVNDGSVDHSLEQLESFAEENEKVKVINFSRNFGHEAAMIAGVDYSEGDGIICMDADLQHPPEYIPRIIEKWESGYDIINMVRTKNEDAGLLKRVTSRGFYYVLNMISPVKFENNASDFFAMSRQVADVLRKNYREKMRFLRGFVQNIGFEKTTIEFEARKRQAGESKYSIKKLINFSVNALFSFSDMPLKLGIYSGIFVAICGAILMIYTIVNKVLDNVPAGYSTIIVVLCFMFAILLMIVGIIGEYISILFAEIKNRPIYIVKDGKNIENKEE